MMRKCYHDGQDPYIALLNLRNTPHQDSDYSSIQRLIGRRTQTFPGLLKPSHTNDYKIQKESQQTKIAERFIARKELKPLQVRDSVMIQPIEPGKKEWIPARVTGQVNPRSYACETADGKTYRRNRRHLRETKGQFVSSAAQENERMRDRSVDTSRNKAERTLSPHDMNRQGPPLPSTPFNHRSVRLSRIGVSMIPRKLSRCVLCDILVDSCRVDSVCTWLKQRNRTQDQATQRGNSMKAPDARKPNNIPVTTKSGRIIKRPTRFGEQLNVENQY